MSSNATVSRQPRLSGSRREDGAYFTALLQGLQQLPDLAGPTAPESGLFQPASRATGPLRAMFTGRIQTSQGMLHAPRSAAGRTAASFEPGIIQLAEDDRGRAAGDSPDIAPGLPESGTSDLAEWAETGRATHRGQQLLRMPATLRREHAPTPVIAPLDGRTTPDTAAGHHQQIEKRALPPENTSPVEAALTPDSARRRSSMAPGRHLADPGGAGTPAESTQATRRDPGEAAFSLLIRNTRPSQRSRAEAVDAVAGELRESPPQAQPEPSPQASYRSSDGFTASHAIRHGHQLPDAVADRPVGPVQQLTVQLKSSDARPVNLYFSQRAADLHVTVRTAEPQAAQNLHQELSGLVDALELRGFHVALPAVQHSAFPDDQSDFTQHHRGSSHEGSGGTGEGHRQNPDRHPKHGHELFDVRLADTPFPHRQEVR